MLTLEDREAIREIVGETTAAVLGLALRQALTELENVRLRRAGKITAALEPRNEEIEPCAAT